MSEYLGKNTFKLGFGLMRLPKLADGSTDNVTGMFVILDEEVRRQ